MERFFGIIWFFGLRSSSLIVASSDADNVMERLFVILLVVWAKVRSYSMVE